MNALFFPFLLILCFHCVVQKERCWVKQLLQRDAKKICKTNCSSSQNAIRIWTSKWVLALRLKCVWGKKKKKQGAILTCYPEETSRATIGSLPFLNLVMWLSASRQHLCSYLSENNTLTYLRERSNNSEISPKKVWCHRS